MTLINDVKKTLCRTGVEMDADDIAEHLSRLPGRGGPRTRTQVSHALHALAASEHDIIRTRPGLYQHQPAAAGPAQPHPPAHPHRPTRVASEISVPPHQLPLEPESSFLDHPAQITADAQYVLEQLTAQTGLDASAVRLETLTAYLLGIATAFLGEARLTWCQGPISTSAELTRQQCAGRTVVAIAAPDVVAEAVVTARQLGTPMQRWTLGPATDTPDLTPAGILQCRQLDLEPLLATCPATRPEAASTPPDSPTAAEGTVPQTGAETSPTRRPSAVMDGWDTLWQLDVALYYRRIDGVTGQGNTHTLKRQALLLGRTYAERWSSVVTDATREQLDAVKDQRWVPGRLYADLLNFADTHGLGVHGSQVIKDLLRRGFWQHTAGTDHDHQQSVAA